MNKKKILIFAHYYAPDVASTGQILQDQAEGMSEAFNVTVICTVPSYTGEIPAAYRKKKLYREEINGVKVLRVPVPEFSKTSKGSRIRNLLAYFLRARRAARGAGPQDYVFTISQPPILGGMLGVYGKRVIRTPEGKRPKLVYCIQDFNPEQILAVGFFGNRRVTDLLMRLDKRSCRKADLVITVGRDLCETLEKRFAQGKAPKYALINNWIDEKQIYPLPEDHPEVAAFRERYGLAGKFVFMYSGNIGLYYDLEGLIRVIAGFRGARAADGREAVFAFVGAGSLLEKLQAFKEEQQLDNVAFIPYQEKEKLIYSLNAADIHLCVNARGIKGVSCPSKFYGIAGVGKPVLGVLEEGSEVRMLIEEIGCGRCVDPGDYEAVEREIRRVLCADAAELKEMGRKGHEYLVRNLTKEISIRKYIRAIQEA